MKEVWLSALAPLTVLCSWIRKVWDSDWIDVVDKICGTLLYNEQLLLCLT